MNESTYLLTPECRVTADGWCAEHSTGAGPVYCRPLGEDA